MATQNNQENSLNTSFTRNIFQPYSPIISNIKTNMLTKQGITFDNCQLEDVESKSQYQISCFEIDSNQGMIFLGTRNGSLIGCDFSFEKKTIQDNFEINFKNEVISL